MSEALTEDQMRERLVLRVARALMARAVERDVVDGSWEENEAIQCEFILDAEAALAIVFESRKEAGRRGGKARHERLSPQRRREIAAMGGRAKAQRKRLDSDG